MNGFSLRHAGIAVALIWSAVLLVPALLGSHWGNVLMLTLLWAYLCVAWNLIGGMLGQISFGHAAFFGIGAYTSTTLLLRFGLSPWLGMVAGGAVAAAAAFIVGYVPFRWRLSHLVFALFTMAFDFVLLYLVGGLPFLGDVNGLYLPVGGPDLWMFRFENRNSYMVTVAAFLTLAIFLTVVLSRTAIGQFWRAIRENDVAAAASGINLFRMKQAGLALSAVLTAMGGTFYAQYVAFIDPHSVFGMDIAIKLIMFTVVGGIGTLLGPIVGAMVLVPLGEILRTELTGGSQFSGISGLVYGIALIVVILAAPHGLVGAIASRWRKTAAPPEDSEPAPELPASKKETRPSSRVLLEVEEINKRFGGVYAVKNVSFSINEGEIFGIIGPNGAGKTTMFTMLSGFQRPNSGQIRFEGRAIEGLEPHQVCRAGIARTFQITQTFPGFTVLDTVTTAAWVGQSRHQADTIGRRLLHETGLWPRRHVLCANLTLAEQRRLEIARALATQPRVLLLDEVMAGLTATEIQEVVTYVASLGERGLTVVMTEHVVRVVMGLCQRVLVLDAGEVVALGTPEAVSRNPDVIEAYLGSKPAGRLPITNATAGP